MSLCAVDWQPSQGYDQSLEGRGGGEPSFRKGKFRHLNCLLSRSLSVLLDTAWRAKVLVQLENKGAQDPGLRISTLVNFISSDLIGGKTMEVIWAPIGGNIVGASVLKQVF